MFAKLHGILYERLTQADRPLEPAVHHKPWLAALFTLLLIGAGQLYNRQLAKAIWYFLAAYLPAGVIVAIWLLLGALVDAETSPPWLVTFASWWNVVVFVTVFLFCILWLFAVLDAYRTAVLLRDGQLAVRYGWKRQALHFAAGFVPAVGDYVPGETVKPHEARQSVGELFRQDVRQRLVKRIVVRLLGFGCMFLLLLLTLLGLLLAAGLMMNAGGLKMK